MQRATILMFGLLLSSCGIYRSSFDCPPGKGLGCASVGEVLNLIVERVEGEDLFVMDKGTALLLRQQEEEKEGSREGKKRKKLYAIREESGAVILVEEPELKE